MEQPSVALEAPFVDREKELGILRSLFDQTMLGRGAVVLVAGEGGIGKTRLVKEFRKYAESKGAMFLAGASFEQEGIVPYAPWTDIIRSVTKRMQPTDIRKIPSWILAEVRRLVPEVVTEAEDLGLKGWLRGGQPSSMVASSTDQERIRMFQAITEFFTKIAEERPVVVFLDDIGWADHASLQLFHFAARRTPEHKLMLIAAYRDVELPEEHPLLNLMLDLNRQRILHQIPLTRFTPDYVSQLIGNHLRGAVASDFSQLLYSRSGGNPFFVEEIVRSLLDQSLLLKSPEGWTIRDIQRVEVPTTIRAVIKQRISRLGDECARFLSIASLLGMEFDFEVLKGVAGLIEDRAITLLETALRAQVIRERKEGTNVFYSFADETVRDFLADQLSLLRRRKYHLALGQALEQVHADEIDDHLGELAYHFIQAAEVEKAKEYSTKAGERSGVLYAHSEAMRHFLNALELLPEDEKEDRLDLLTKISEVAYRSLDHKHALEFSEEAIEIAQKLGLKTKMADLYYLKGLSYFFQGSTNESLRSYMKGLEALGEEDSVQKAVLCQQIGRVYVLTGEPHLGLDWVKRAIDIASRVGANWVLAHAYQTLALGLPLSEKDSIIKHLEHAFKLAENHWLEDPSRDVLGRAYDNLAQNYSWIKGDYKLAAELLLQGVNHARKAALPHFQAWLQGALALYAYLPMGEWEKSRQAAHESIKIARELGEIKAYNALAFIAYARGEFQKARELVNYVLPIAVKSAWPEFFVQSYQIVAAIQMEQDEIDEAEQNLLKAFEYRGKGTGATEALMIEIAFGLVKVRLRKGDLEKASAYHQELQKIASTLNEKWGYAYERWSRGLIAEAKADINEAIKLLEESVEFWKSVERPYDLARAHIDLGRVLQNGGSRSEAEQSFEAARKIFDRLGILQTLMP